MKAHIAFFREYDKDFRGCDCSVLDRSICNCAYLTWNEEIVDEKISGNKIIFTTKRGQHVTCSESLKVIYSDTTRGEAIAVA